MSDLVRGKLAQAGQGGRDRIVGAAPANLVGTDKAFEDQHVLPHAQEPSST
jgi:hypothetical protein